MLPLEKKVLEANFGCDHVCVEINQGSRHFKLSRSQTELSQDLGSLVKRKKEEGEAKKQNI